MKYTYLTTEVTERLDIFTWFKIELNTDLKFCALCLYMELFDDYVAVLLQAHFTKTRGRARSLSAGSNSVSRPIKRIKIDMENRSASRSQSRPPRDESGVKNVAVSSVI